MTITTYVALLRAVNVGGAALLPMAELREIGRSLGFANVRTFITSGNLVFDSAATPAAAKAALEARLAARAGRPVGVMIRTGRELRRVLQDNPFPQARPDRTVAIFLDAAPAPDTVAAVRNLTTEEIALGPREIYVHYSDGIGRSRLVIPAAATGTARNMNTIARLVEMADAA